MNTAHAIETTFQVISAPVNFTTRSSEAAQQGAKTVLATVIHFVEQMISSGAPRIVSAQCIVDEGEA